MTIKLGDRIAQIIFEKNVVPEIEEITELPPTDKGNAVFGSTGMVNSVSKLAMKHKEKAVWEEHSLVHWGAEKILWALKKKAIAVPLNQIKKIVAKCKICAKS